MTTLNLKEKDLLAKLMEHPLFDTLVPEGDEKLVDSIRSKVNKKRIDKKAVIPAFTIGDATNQQLTFKMGKDNGSLIVTANKETFKDYKQYFRFKWNLPILIQLTNQFHSIASFWGEKLTIPYHKGYGDDFNVYENEVERSYGIGRDGISFTCYTGDENDDNWTRIRPARMKECVKMMMSYIFLHEELDNHFSELNEEIQAFYPEWKERLDNNDLVTG